MKDYIPKSSLGWIDFSKKDRDKVLKVMEMLKGENTVDELGIGIIRNALSDEMFPGITTIMTRAKYFFIVPRILQEFLSNNNTKITAANYLRQEENLMIETLAKKYNYESKERIIGITIAEHNKNKSVKKKELVRKPSVIYWTGIVSFDIYAEKLTLSNVLLEADRLKKNPDHSSFILGDENTNTSKKETNCPIIFSLPDYAANWKDDIHIHLTHIEADFLKNKIIDKHSNKLLGKILSEDTMITEFLEADNFEDFSKCPLIADLPQKIRDVVLTAQGFWDLLKGAHIRYNIILHGIHGANADYKQLLIQSWIDWVENIKLFEWDKFDQSLLWRITNKERHVKPFTEKFINDWIEAIKEENYQTEYLDDLVVIQEQKNKGYRSKLKIENDKTYDNWVGISELNYRFGNAKIIVEDIIRDHVEL